MDHAPPDRPGPVAPAASQPGLGAREPRGAHERAGDAAARGLRLERITALSVAAALIVVRSLVYLLFEHAYFDSDQAINGLMAKHLAEGRALPLFFYGQGYMLAVEAWLAAPWMWVFGPTVAALRASLVVTNLAIAALLVLGLERHAGLRPLHALAASVFFLLASPFAAARLVEAQGGNVEVFLWILLAWFVRSRPVWLGVVLGVGFLNREFTLYAVPVLLAGEAMGGRLRARDALRRWVITAAAFAVVWEVVMALQPWADLMGPGTRGAMLGGFAGDPAANLAGRGRLDLTAMPGHVVTVLGLQLAQLIGVRETTWLTAAGHDWLAWPAAVAALVAVARVLWVLRVLWGQVLHRSTGSHARPDPTVLSHARPDPILMSGAGFAWYLVGVGLVALVAYAAFRTPGLGTIRYALLTLLLPIGLSAALLAVEPRRAIRTTAIALVIVWATASAFDTARHLVSFATHPPPDDIRALVEHLRARGVSVAESNYWVAYKATFIAQERIRFAASDFSRIAEYQHLADRNRDRLVFVEDHACAGGEKVGAWWVCR